jgi:hypothetical protein
VKNAAMTPLRIAMWSGPRNLSTALMRAWENRPDTAVSDEPLYAHYLVATGIDHPGRTEVIAAQETDWRRVVEALLGPAPGDRAVWYQKHMSHHLLPGMGRDWIDGLANCFLIRDPREVLASYVRKRAEVSLADIGLEQQAEIFRRVRDRTGAVPPVVDAADLLRDPPRVLGALCERLGLPFSPRMLSWAAGPRASDGVWAKHWYAAVERSTGFAPYRSERVELSPALEEIARAAEPFYRELWRHRIA